MRTLLSVSLALGLFTACSGSSSEPASSSAATGTGATGTEVAGGTSNEAAEGSDDEGAEVAVCGTRGASPCPAGTFCNYVAGSNCGADDRGGRCEPIPAACTREFMPVCGCDGQTHPTACTAHSAGVSVAHDGPC